MWRWFGRWLAFSYAPHLIAQAGVPFTVLALYGFSSALEEFLASHRILVTAALIVHFIAHLIAAMGSVERERLAELRRQHLDDDHDLD